jgi:hypothetical protein
LSSYDAYLQGRLDDTLPIFNAQEIRSHLPQVTVPI